ncbi:MAG: rRNA methyltransferase [Arachnia propionica]|nr:MAG: rRNA methyltransferase [Arachnia propionica]
MRNAGVQVDRKILADLAVNDPGAFSALVAVAKEHQALPEPGDVEVVYATPPQLRQLSDTVQPQGIVAVCRQPAASWDALAGARLVVVCAQVRDPGNAGTIIRDADAFGADAVILTTGSVELYNPKTVRASMGSIFHLPVFTGVELVRLVEQLKARGLQLLAAEADGESIVALTQDGTLAKPTAWLFGNEAWGLPAADASLADQTVAIPMPGAAESLNLASAAAICLYQSSVSQRRERSAHVGP